MKLPHVRIALGMIAASLLVLLAGCGSKLASTVSGTVKLDGNPLTSGTVTFHPTGAGPVAYGQVDSGGRYTLSTGSSVGIAPGEYIVTVVAVGPAEVESTPGQAPTAPKPLTPAKYGTKELSDLKKTIVAGKNDVPLELSSQ